MSALTPPAVSAPLQPPAGSTLALRLHAEGAQVYVCKASMPAGTFAWTLKAPDAKLFDASGAQVGTHFGGPTWQSSVDGSAVIGAKVADAPVAGTIPWLLLKAQANAGNGVFSRITSVQRVDTVGGLTPSSGCDASADGTEQPVTYSANYYFYTSPAAERSFQAAAGEQAFGARLTGDAEVPPVATAASGSFELVLNAAQTELRYRLRHDMTGATLAHLHTGGVGESGPVAIPLPSALDDLTGVVAVTPAQVADLMAGRLYANVHSPAHMTGEIRGQLGRP
jgi:hypothetical protein